MLSPILDCGLIAVYCVVAFGYGVHLKETHGTWYEPKEFSIRHIIKAIIWPVILIFGICETIYRLFSEEVPKVFNEIILAIKRGW